VALGEQQAGDCSADVAGATGDQDVLGVGHLSIRVSDDGGGASMARWWVRLAALSYQLSATSFESRGSSCEVRVASGLQ
jgi:hypothetical protein